MYIKTVCVAQLTKASDTQAVGRWFKPRPDHKIGLKIIFSSDLI